VNSLPKTVTRQHRGCDLNPGLSAPESSMLTTRLQSHPGPITKTKKEKSAPMTRHSVLRKSVRTLCTAIAQSSYGGIRITYGIMFALN